MQNMFLSRSRLGAALVALLAALAGGRPAWSVPTPTALDRPAGQTAAPAGADSVLGKPVDRRSPAERAAARGFEALMAGDVPTAATHFDEALKSEPTLTAALLGMAEVHLRQGTPQQAEALIRKALSAEPSNPDVHAAVGRLRFSQGQYAQAKVAYQKAIQLDPQAFLAHLDLGDLYLSADRDAKAAVAEYRKALAIKPDYTPGRLGLGMALLAAGDRPGALAELERVTKAAPQDPTAWHLIGRIHAADGRYADAVAALSEALRVESDFLPALLDRADVYAEMGEDRKAAADYEQAARRNPKDAVSQVKLGMIYQRSGETSKAQASYRAALRLDPKIAIACNNLAMIALRTDGNLDEALALAKRAVAASPQVPQFHDTLGWVHRARGERPLAIASLEKATTLPPSQADIWYHLGQVYEESGRKDDARAAYRKALTVDPKFADAAAVRARIAALTK